MLYIELVTVSSELKLFILVKPLINFELPKCIYQILIMILPTLILTVIKTLNLI